MVREKKPAAADVLNPAPRGQAAEAHEVSKLPDYSWAVNAVKLNRAKAFVQQTNPELRGKDKEDAVKARYVEIHGLLESEVATQLPKGKVRGKTKNLSEDDGSND